MSPKSRRVYVPMTGKKRFKGHQSQTYKARLKLETKKNLVLSKAQLIFEEMALDPIVARLGSDDKFPRQHRWQRLTASRFFYALPPFPAYVKSIKVPWKDESLQAEAIVKASMADQAKFELGSFEFVHPVNFFLGCQPDGVFLDGQGYHLLEVKTLFHGENGVLNEFGDQFDEEADLQKWINQLQFSLQISQLQTGLLVIFDWESQTTEREIGVRRDQSFWEKNLNSLKAFFLEVVFFTNSIGRIVKPSFRRQSKTMLRSLLESHLERKRVFMAQNESIPSLNEYFRTAETGEKRLSSKAPP